MVRGELIQCFVEEGDTPCHAVDVNGAVCVLLPCKSIVGLNESVKSLAEGNMNQFNGYRPVVLHVRRIGASPYWGRQLIGPFAK